MKNIPPQQLRFEAPDESHSAELQQPKQLSPSQENRDSVHIPVLLEDVVRLLNPHEGETYLDLTAGYGGHASRIIDVIGPSAATLVDRDARAITHLSGYGQKGAELVHTDFATAAQHLADAGRHPGSLRHRQGMAATSLRLGREKHRNQHAAQPSG